MKSFNRSWRIVFFGFIFVALSQCGWNAPKLPENTARDSDRNQEDPLANPQPPSGSTPTVSKYYPEYHSTRLKKAFSSWGVMLSVEPFNSHHPHGGSRNSHYPSNWISLIDENCNEVGVFTDEFDCNMFKRIDPNRALTKSTIGSCVLRYNSNSGEIVSATILIHKGYQEHPTPWDVEKQIVYTHELGHCLGLRHTDDFLGNLAFAEDYIMRSSVSNRSTTPHVDELDVIKFSYGENGPKLPSETTPSGRLRSDFFEREKDNPLWHRSLPVFYYYDPTSTSSTLTVKQSDGVRESDEDLDEDLTTIIFNYYSDGSTMVEKETHKSDGSTVVEKEIHKKH